jgi:hypothetical protein
MTAAVKLNRFPETRTAVPPAPVRAALSFSFPKPCRYKPLAQRFPEHGNTLVFLQFLRRKRPRFCFLRRLAV